MGRKLWRRPAGPRCKLQDEKEGLPNNRAHQLARPSPWQLSSDRLACEYGFGQPDSVSCRANIVRANAKLLRGGDWDNAKGKDMSPTSSTLTRLGQFPRATPARLQRATWKPAQRNAERIEGAVVQLCLPAPVCGPNRRSARSEDPSADPSRGPLQGRIASPADCPFADRATPIDRSHTTGKWLLIVSQQPLRSTGTDSWGSSLR